MTAAIRLLFLLAALYGLAILAPMFVRPQGGGGVFAYAFAGAAAATQLCYLLVAWAPRRFRPLMLVGIASKGSFALAALVLAPTRALVPFAFADLALAGLFAGAWVAARTSALAPERAPR